jgi:hypothetical protein
MVVTLVGRVGTGKTDPFCEGKEEGSVSVEFKGARIRSDTKGRRNLLLSSQPFVTKLANTLSACVLLIGDVSAFTSRSAAREEMEYELFGASMICSTWSE